MTDYVFELSVQEDGNIRLERLSEDFTKTFGYQPEEIDDLQKLETTLVHSEDIGALRGLVDKVQSGSPAREEFRFITRQGDIRWVELYETPVYDEKNENLIGIMGAGADITLRKQAEQSLRESEEQARRRLDEIESIYYHAPVGLCVFDEKLRFIRINDSMAEMNGVSPAGHIGKTPREIVPGIADTAEQIHQHIMETGEALRDIEISGTTSSQPGVERTWVEHWSPLKDKNGKVVGINVVAEEVTETRKLEEELRTYREHLEEAVEARTAEVRQVIDELKAEAVERGKAEAELRETNQLLESFFRTSHLLIAYMDRDFNFIRVNQAYADIEGQPPSYFVGKNHFDLYPHDENRRIFQQVVDTGGPYTVSAKPFEFPGRPEWGTTYWDWTLLPIKNPEGEVEGLVLYLLDVTEEIELQQQVEKQRAMSVHADRLRSLGEMAAGISHELNQPLTGIRNTSEHLLIALRKGWDINRENMEERVLNIVKNTDRMSHVINHTRMYARGGKEGTTPQRSSVNQVIDDAAGLVEAQLKARGIHLEIIRQDDLPHLVLNPFSLEEVILNIINNAGDAILELQKDAEGPSSPFITVKTRAEEDETGKCVKIEISDQGKGMSGEVKKQVFEPFFTTKDMEHGTGLGLPICKNIVEDMGGTINISSEQGVGTTVTINLPQKR